MAGIWDVWYDTENQPVNTFSIITTESNQKMRSIHHRMPVILAKDKEEIWLHSQDIVKLTKLLIPIDDSQIEMYPVSKKVNSVKNNGEEIIYPITIGEQGSLF